MRRIFSQTFCLAFCAFNLWSACAYPFGANFSIHSFDFEVSPVFETGPAVFIGLTTKKDGTKAVISWITSSETNGDHFEVQHSLDALNWDVLAKITAKGTPTDTTSYSFTHNTPVEAANYYRLKAVGKDSSFVYSRIMQLNFTVPPAQFSTFSGKQEDGGVKLSWTTASEYKNDLFLVENTQGTFWDVIGTVKATGSEMASSYTLVHENPNPGDNYYRLSAVRGTSPFAYEKIIKVEVMIPSFVLDTFFVQKDGTNALLGWSTLSETKNSRFEIEHSISGTGSWNQIGQVSAKGESTLPVNYSFLHAFPSEGKNFYRLKMIGLDENVVYSDSVLFELNPIITAIPETINFKVYPNPATSKIYFETPSNLPVRINLANAYGQTLLITKETFVKELDVSKLVPGVYFLSLSQHNGQVFQFKIVR